MILLQLNVLYCMIMAFRSLGAGLGFNLSVVTTTRLKKKLACQKFLQTSESARQAIIIRPYRYVCFKLRTVLH